MPANAAELVSFRRYCCVARKTSANASKRSLNNMKTPQHEGRACSPSRDGVMSGPRLGGPRPVGSGLWVGSGL